MTESKYCRDLETAADALAKAVRSAEAVRNQNDPRNGKSSFEWFRTDWSAVLDAAASYEKARDAPPSVTI